MSRYLKVTALIPLEGDILAVAEAVNKARGPIDDFRDAMAEAGFPDAVKVDEETVLTRAPTTPKPRGRRPRSANGAASDTTTAAVLGGVLASQG